MRPSILVLTLLLALPGCKPEDAPAELRPIRTLTVDTKPITDDRHAIGEVKPRYESDLSFRVAGKVLVPAAWMLELASSKATRWRRSTRRTIKTACAPLKRTSRRRGRSGRSTGNEARQGQAVEGWLDAKSDLRRQPCTICGSAEAGARLPRPISTSPATSSVTPAKGRLRRSHHRCRRRSRSERQCRANGGEARATRTTRMPSSTSPRPLSPVKQQQRARSDRLAAVQSRSGDRRAWCGRSLQSPIRRHVPIPSKSRSRTRRHSSASA